MVKKKIRTIRFDKIIRTHKERHNDHTIGYIVVLLAVLLTAYSLSSLQGPVESGFSESYCMNLIERYDPDIRFYSYTDVGSQKVSVTKEGEWGRTVAILYDGAVVKQCSISTFNLDLDVSYENSFACSEGIVKFGYSDVTSAGYRMVATETATSSGKYQQVVFYNPDYMQNADRLLDEIFKQLTTGRCV